MAEERISKMENKQSESTPDEQVEFLARIISDQQEYKKLLNDPEGYCSKQSITLDVEVLEIMEDIVMKDNPIRDEVCKQKIMELFEKLRKKKWFPKKVIRKPEGCFVSHNTIRIVMKKYFDVIDLVNPPRQIDNLKIKKIVNLNRTKK
jgi:hypothetical protein